MNRPSFRDFAMAYANRGWQVFPIEPCGKRPARLVARGLHDATTEERPLRYWWELEPQANVGVRTGVESGLVVLDVDRPDGMAVFRALAQGHGQFRAAWASTGSGGWHAYLAHPGEEIRNSAGKLGRGIDVRGDGGYVVAPPSRHSTGRLYVWRQGIPAELPAMPDWLMERLTERPTLPTVEPTTADRRVQARMPYARAAVSREADDVAASQVGQRNRRLNAAAFSLGQLALDGSPAGRLQAAASAARHRLSMLRQMPQLSNPQLRNQQPQSSLPQGACRTSANRTSVPRRSATGLSSPR